MSEITTPHAALPLTVGDRYIAGVPLCTGGDHHIATVFAGSQYDEAALARAIAESVNAYPALIAERDALRDQIAQLARGLDDALTCIAAMAVRGDHSTVKPTLMRLHALLSSSPATGEGR